MAVDLTLQSTQPLVHNDNNTPVWCTAACHWSAGCAGPLTVTCSSWCLYRDAIKVQHSARRREKGKKKGTFVKTSSCHVSRATGVCSLPSSISVVPADRSVTTWHLKQEVCFYCALTDSLKGMMRLQSGGYDLFLLAKAENCDDAQQQQRSDFKQSCRKLLGNEKLGDSAQLQKDNRSFKETYLTAKVISMTSTN